MDENGIRPVAEGGFVSGAVHEEIASGSVAQADVLDKEDEEEDGVQQAKRDAADGCPVASVHHHPLRCHVLFSSPLCVGHTVKVQVETATSMLAPEVEVKSWGVDFLGNHPCVVHAVHREGHLAAWNNEQDAIQNLVRQGDSLIQISFAGIAMKVNGQSPSVVLQHIFREYLVRSGGELPAHADSPGSVDLFFSGMRSLPQLRIDDEIGMLQGTGCEFIPHAATTENIRTLISANECRILHFSFHTSSDQSRRVFLEDIHGKAHVLTSQEFQSLLLQGGQEERQQQTALVFISSCHSFSLGQNIVAAGVRHVICVRDEHSVMDSSCRLFARHFFIALGAGRSVQQAFECGASALKSSPHKRVRDDGCKFALLPEDGDHSEILASRSVSQREVKFAVSAEVTTLCHASTQCHYGWGSVPASAEDFVGREVDVYRLLVLLRSDSHARRLVLLCGDTGVGKSALMAEVGRFVQSRYDLFDEVRWVATLDRSGSSLECENGLKDLRKRLVASTRWRALLLIDDPSMFFWWPVQQLLTIPTVHAVLAVTPTVGLMAEIGAEANAAGVKPVRFLLGPLDPLAQAQLFLGRASRELYTSEVEVDPGASLGAAVWTVQRPADYLALADSELVRPHGGNPRQILTTAQSLPSPKAFSREPNEMTAEGDLSGGPAPPHRKVRLLLPGGREVCEWLPVGMLMRDVLKERSPKGSQDSIDIFVEGCLVQPDMSLAHFGGSQSRELLLLEFREKASDG